MSVLKQGESHLLSSYGPVGLAAASGSGLSRQQLDPWTTVRLPGAKSSNECLLQLMQSQRHTGTERPARTRGLKGEAASQFLIFTVC